MKNIIVITNRKLCNDFETQIQKLCELKVGAIVVREKDLNEKEYRDLFIRTKRICDKYKVPCRIHNFYNVGIELSSEEIHLPLHVLRENNKEIVDRFNVIGVSVHTTNEVSEAIKLGATYITAGHIFETDCKKGIPQKGLKFLEEICNVSSLPVYAIGGMSINEECVTEMKKHGASGICVMSKAMTI